DPSGLMVTLRTRRPALSAALTARRTWACVKLTALVIGGHRDPLPIRRSPSRIFAAGWEIRRGIEDESFVIVSWAARAMWMPMRVMGGTRHPALMPVFTNAAIRSRSGIAGGITLSCQNNQTTIEETTAAQRQAENRH